MRSRSGPQSIYEPLEPEVLPDPLLDLDSEPPELEEGVSLRLLAAGFLSGSLCSGSVTRLEAGLAAPGCIRQC